ncbi:MAG TPA: folate-binding protein [Alphaproteobacteria bacterium]|nr:folate-binding protein [Alphaproteobacteria bacterium]
MAERSYAILEHRGIVTVGGPDRESFLQGMVSNDVHRAGPERAIWAAFLTPQGKYRHDFFLVEIGGACHLDCEGGERLMDLGRGLSRYKLRAEIDLGIAKGYAVVALWGEGTADALGLPDEAGAARPLDGGAAFVDPRLAAAGARALLPVERVAETLEPLGFTQTSTDDYDRMRLALGLPDGSRDMTVDKTILLEANFDRLNGVDWDKGCYVGQELTARTRYRGLIKRRLVPVAIEGTAPPPGTKLMRDGKEAGEMRSSRDGLGIALVRLEHAGVGDGVELSADGATIRLRDAAWMQESPAG